MSDEDRRRLERRIAEDPTDTAAQEALLLLRDRAGEGIRQGLAQRLAAALAKRQVDTVREASMAIHEILVLRRIYNEAPARVRDARRGRSVVSRLMNLPENDALREIGRMLGRENEVEGALYIGRQYVGCSGMHNGTGRPGCPKRRHHHHDEKCRQEDRVTDTWLTDFDREVTEQLIGLTMPALAGLVSRASWPRAENIISVQPMSNRMGRIHYLDVVTERANQPLMDTGRLMPSIDPPMQNIPPPRTAEGQRIRDAINGIVIPYTEQELRSLPREAPNMRMQSGAQDRTRRGR